MNRWIVLLSFVSSVAFPARDVDAKPARPNVVLILADDLGREALGCYGGESYKTPKLDGLARGGMRFEHGYVMPVCHPTRLTLLTGRYPSRFVDAKWGAFPKASEGETLAWSLKKAGYRTAVAGKWQLTLLGKDLEQPHRLGFDEYSVFGWHEGPRYYNPWIWQNGKKRNDVLDKYGPDVYCDFLLDFIDRGRSVEEGQESGKPFFTFFSMALAHDVTDDIGKPVPFAPGKDRYDDYREMVESLDRIVGRFVAGLEERGLRKSTLVIFVADNGSPSRFYSGVENGKLVKSKIESRWKGRLVPGGKGSLSDLGIRVPMIASWPGTISAGSVSEELVDVSDFLPTFVELGGAKAPAGVSLDGYSFREVLRGGKSTRSWIFAERKKSFCIRSRDWKLYGDGRLFDMKSDPDERGAIRAKNDTPESKLARTKLESAFKQLPIGSTRP